MLSHKGPFPSVSFNKQSAANIQPPMMFVGSGELVANVERGVMGAARASGRVSDVWLSVGRCGADESQTAIGISGEVYINDTTCLTTVPTIYWVSGEASQQKTTKETGDTGIVQAVIDTSANTFRQGDIISGAITVDRTGTPTTELRDAVLVVEFEPELD